MPGLVLRDVHRPAAPALWPPAPGWWLVLAALLVVVAVIVFVQRRHAQRRATALALFDNALDGVELPAQRLARCSELLRRAARRIRPDADRLDGDDWLAFLETRRLHFREGSGRLLLDGPFRRDVDPRAAMHVEHLARERFVELMARRA